MIKIQNLSCGYGKNEILHDISLECKKGEITTIIGPNGSGKTTLLKSFIGMTDIIKGDILIDSHSILSISSIERAKIISYLSQGKTIPNKTVFQTVLQGRFPHLSYSRRYKKTDYEKAFSALTKMDSENLSDIPLCELSGGMRQKVYIAMALCQETSVIIFDEPSTYLDIQQQFNVASLMKILSEEGKTIINVMHDIPLAMKISNKIAIIDKGKIAREGTPSEIFNSGVIDEIFKIKLNSFINEGNVEYFCTPRK